MASRLRCKTAQRELTPFQRGLILGASRFGATPTSIANAFNNTRQAVQFTIQHAAQLTNGEYPSRIGRLKAYTERDERLILRIVRLQPGITYKELVEASGCLLSHDTLYRILKQYNITN